MLPIWTVRVSGKVGEFDADLNVVSWLLLLTYQTYQRTWSQGNTFQYVDLYCQVLSGLGGGLNSAVGMLKCQVLH